MNAATLTVRLVMCLGNASHGVQKLCGWFGGGVKNTGACFESIRFRLGKLFALVAGIREEGFAVYYMAAIPQVSKRDAFFLKHSRVICVQWKWLDRLSSSNWMSFLPKTGVLLLVFLLAGVPLTACMLPSAALSAEEQACCREMGDQCGQESMPTSHPCCKTVGPTDHHAIAKSSFKLIRESQTLYQVQPIVLVAEKLRIAAADLVAVGHAPPEPPPPSIDLLRI